MGKLIIISNRLPVNVIKNGENIEYRKSIGGLATGLKSYHEQADSIWVGWPGIPDEEIDLKEKEAIEKELKETYQCLPVYLNNEDVAKYYHGFCNNTIWPLFHYFTSKTDYDVSAWEAYKRVNRKFFETIEAIIGEDDIFWIHDYHLMLLPQMIKDKYPHTQVGFFLHIPWPSFEIFRLLIWREEILKGLLGADLIGFHTYDYLRHFLSSVSRLLSLEYNFHKIGYEDRYVQVDAFPMGIDYERFSGNIDRDMCEVETEELVESTRDTKTILSIDRLDYTKGIPQRIKAFYRFLCKYPEYREKVRLNLIVAPSRIEMESYDDLRHEITELISEVNGKYGTLNWMPIWFFFRSFTQESLITLYRHADVLLVTPVRDGMNLVAKEYIAARQDFEGMVVISETAGAASELGEAVIVNANDYNGIAGGIKYALEMPRDEKMARNKMMHRRLQRYNVGFWAAEFLNALANAYTDSFPAASQKSFEREIDDIEQAYRKARKRILFLDYDGTLVGFKPIPEQARPDEELLSLLSDLAADPRNSVVIVSGRDRHTLDKWLGGLNLYLLASHGLWFRSPKQENWTMIVSLDNDWKDSVRHILELYTDRVPGSLIEEKEFSLAWHYRQCEPDMAAVKLSELREALLTMIRTTTLGLQEGNKVLEVKDTRVNKGSVASVLIQNQDYDFILGAGDDSTDEDLFLSLPPGAFSVKIGSGNSNAQYHLKSWQSMRLVLKQFAAISS